MVAASNKWHISLLGGLGAERGPLSLTRFRTQKTGGLLAYLACHPDRLHSRDVLTDMLWPDDDHELARGSFRTALNSLRKQLEPPEMPRQSVLIADRFHVHLRSEAFTTDVGLFHHAIQEAHNQKDPPDKTIHLVQAVQVYRGEFLPGFYDDWVLTERRHLEEAYTGALRQLIGHAENIGDLTAALEYALRIVAIDPISEEAHVTAIRLFRKAGRPREAILQYDALAHILQEKLYTVPGEESRLLAASIRETLMHPITVRRSRRQARIVPANQPHRIVARQGRSLPPPSIPLSLMPFFGREQEIEHLVELLSYAAQSVSTPGKSSRHRVRLLTLLGPGGSGKTRLSIEVARQCRRAFAEAVWFVSLADLSETHTIPDAILDTMELSRTLDAPWFTAIQAVLGERTGLLILDNFEHLLDGGRYIHDLLTSLPGIVCLTTSRTQLDLDGERIIVVSPLPVPAKEQLPLNTLAEYPSIRLFIDRAQAARADFQLTLQNADTVAELCRRLEGLPLALELAASWAQILTPHQMLGRTHNPLALGARRKRNGTGRHESLRATIESSYRLLSTDQQALFRRLSVFRGGWNLAAALTVCSEEAEPPNERSIREETMLRGLTLLTESSLVLTEEITLESGPEIRFFMLEMLREYGAERLTPEENKTVCERHTAYFFEIVEAYSADLDTRNRDRLDPDLDNLRTALLWISERPEQGEQALRMTVAMFKLWAWWGHQAEAREWVERFLACAPPDSPLLAEALNVVGNLCFYMNDGEASMMYQKRHLEVRRVLNDELGSARALSNFGNALNIMGRYPEARPLQEESCAILRKLGAYQYLPGALLNLGCSVDGVGEHERGRELFWEALRGYEQIGHQIGMALCYRSLGQQAKKLGNLSEARDMFERSLNMSQNLGASNTDAILAELLAVQEALNTVKDRKE